MSEQETLSPEPALDVSPVEASTSYRRFKVDRVYLGIAVATLVIWALVLPLLF